MSVQLETYRELEVWLKTRQVTLVAVSKTKPEAEILGLYEAGQRDFGENYVQELLTKQASLPTDIRWHFIGHLQTNKVKAIVPFVHLIHGLDSYRLLQEVDKQAARQQLTVNVLLQVHIAREETKFGFNETELEELFYSSKLQSLENVRVRGFMGMASFSEQQDIIRTEFTFLKSLFEKYKTLAPLPDQFNILSMGMSGDFRLAVEAGSTMVRIGSLLFGARG